MASSSFSSSESSSASVVVETYAVNGEVSSGEQPDLGYIASLNSVKQS